MPDERPLDYETPRARRSLPWPLWVALAIVTVVLGVVLAFVLLILGIVAVDAFR